MHHFELFGIQIELAQSIIGMWYIMGALTVFSLIVNFAIRRGKFKLVPESKFQILVEGFVEFVYNVVRGTMGERNKHLAPYIGALIPLLFFSNAAGLFAFKKIPSSDFSVCLGFAFATFFVVQASQLRAHKLKGYVEELFEPIPALFPLKVLEKFTPLLSMSLRLFCNITAGVIVLELVYEATIEKWIHGWNPMAAFTPVPLHFYFDIFDAGIQTLVFVMLTMVLTANATEVHAPDPEHGHGGHH